MGEAGGRDPSCLRAWAENRAASWASRAGASPEPTAPTPSPDQNGAADMGGTGVIDHFLEVFTRYIDSGFGLLGGEVAFIATTLIVIDVTLAALFWSWGADDDIIARLVKKTLFVGVFAYIIGNWNNLARIVFESFAGLGLKASARASPPPISCAPARSRRPASTPAGRCSIHLRPDGLGLVLRELHPDRLPAVRLGAGAARLLHPRDPALRHPDRVQADDARRLRADPVRPVRQIRLHGRARARQRHLVRHQGAGARRHHRHRLDAVLRVHRRLRRRDPIDDAMAIVLAALSLLGLGIFGPGIANGLVSGGPQLGAGAAVGTGLAAGGMVAAGAAPSAPWHPAARLAGGAAAAARGGAGSRVARPPPTASARPASPAHPASPPVSAMSPAPAHESRLAAAARAGVPPLRRASNRWPRRIR
jgi:type IV secretion system protein TrbL